MNILFNWFTCLCFVFGTDILCNGKIIKHQNATLSKTTISRMARSLLLNNSCLVDEFNCANGMCIDSSEVCDGLANCSDGSDETQNLCTMIFPRCQSYLFRCNYGACVDKNVLCNGIKECVDGSDENLPECRVTHQANKNHSQQFNESTNNCRFEEYTCRDGQCIEDTTVCDGYQNCQDGSDESLDLCRTILCPTYAFKCRYGACVSKASKCDGVKHCADGSDEDRCSTTKPLPSVIKPTIISTPTTPYPINIKKCTLPSVQEGIVYSYNNSNNVNVISSGDKVDQYTVVDVNCKDEYYKNSVLTLTMICLPNGQWSSTFTDLCLKKCPPVTIDSLEITCTLNGEPADCKKSSIPGTKLKPKCKPNHVLRNGQLETPIQLQCRNNGTWFGGKLYSCVQRNLCGQIFTRVEPLITNGARVQYGSTPWNVAVYRMNDMIGYEMICGGTLIASNLVISAAHCFWQEGSNNRIFTNINGQYKVAVGKYTRDIKITDNNFTQIIDVGLIYIKNGYNGSIGYYTEDIAVIVLSTKVKISNVVMPVCMDWKKKYSVPNGSTGKIVGWGNTEKMVPSPILLEAYLPIIDQITCRNMYTNGFQYFITSDKFCAGSQLGQGVDEGDSGAGLTYAHGISYYLIGIASVKDPMTDNSLGVFTNISNHIGWIRNIFINNSYVSDNIYVRDRTIA